jgi:hypothetical protein
MSGTYFGLRRGLIGLSIVLPLGLPVLAGFWGIDYQQSLSAYYHAGDGSVRDLFVGLLFAVGAGLYLYKGYSNWENGLLNAAALFVVAVGLKPMPWPENQQASSSSLADAAVEVASWHGAFAVAFFLCIAAVCLFCSGKTLREVKDPVRRARYRRLYRGLGVLMVIAPLSASVATLLLAQSYTIIVAETFGVLAFGLYWLFKTLELEHSSAEQHALTGTLDLPVAPATVPSEPTAVSRAAE